MSVIEIDDVRLHFLTCSDGDPELPCLVASYLSNIESSQQFNQALQHFL
jgi:hypothetical protein